MRVRALVLFLSGFGLAFGQSYRVNTIRNAEAATFVPVPDNNSIRMVDTNGTITTVYGGVAGYNGENFLSSLAASGGPNALAPDLQGNIYL
jgi:hypothetical protein